MTQFFSQTGNKQPKAPLGVSRRAAMCGIAASCLLFPRIARAQEARPAAPPIGNFRGRVIAEWLQGGRQMRLIEPFEYIAADGTPWPVPAGTIVDGASIPKVFWSVIGGPFEGLYREPSVVHDYYCTIQSRHFEEVHRVFFEAMLASGVSESRAWLMYKAVTNFGPSWATMRSLRPCDPSGDPSNSNPCPPPATRSASPAPRARKADLNKFADDIQGQVDPADLDLLRDAISKAN